LVVQLDDATERIGLEEGHEDNGCMRTFCVFHEVGGVGEMSGRERE
jgi:hypothetical protein